MVDIESRYSIALFDHAKENKKVAEYRDEAKEIIDTFYEIPEMTEFLENSIIQKSDKVKLLNKVFSSTSYLPILKLMLLMVEAGRSVLILPVMKRFVYLCNQELGVEEGIIYTSSSLSKKELLDFEKEYGEKLFTNLKLVNKIDESVVGGAKIVLRDKIIDLSAKSQVSQLRRELLKERKQHEN